MDKFCKVFTYKCSGLGSLNYMLGTNKCMKTSNKAIKVSPK